jgi:hypothetical protein
MNHAFDFKGNLQHTERRLAVTFKDDLDWTAVDRVVTVPAGTTLDMAAIERTLAPFVEAEMFATRASYDALSRATQVRPPRRRRT